MTIGPIEVMVIGFPGNNFNGEIIPELERLIDAEIITLVDALLIRRDADGSVDFVEFEDDDANPEAARLARLMQQLDSMISDEDVAELAAGLAPDSSAAMLVIEHTWAKGFRDAVLDSGGIMTANFRVPGLVVDELLNELDALAEVAD